MGSFLLNCGVSNSSLNEGTPVHLFFISKFVVNSNDAIQGSQFDHSTWVAENFMIEGIQDDCGSVNVPVESNDKMIRIMKALCDHSAETPTENSSQLSWKQYCTEHISSWDLSYDAAHEHFKEMLRILHSRGIAFKDPIQRTISQMYVSHVSSSAIDVIKETPYEYEVYGFKYNGEFEYNRALFGGYDDHIDFLIYTKLKSIEQLSHFSTWNDVYNSDSLYFTLFKESHVFDLDIIDFRKPLEFDKNEVINKMLSIMECRILVNYMSQFGIDLVPSVYVGQDYSDTRGKNYRRAMESVFNKKREELILRDFDASDDGDFLTYDENGDQLKMMLAGWSDSKNPKEAYSRYLENKMVMHSTLDDRECISKYYQQYPKRQSKV